MDIYQIIGLLFLAITAIATSFYAYLTWKLAQPLVSVMTEQDENDSLTRNLLIENVGTGTAHDVEFKVVPDFQQRKNIYLSQTGLFKNGLQIFSPHTKIKIYLTWMPSDYENKIENPLNIEVTYKNRIGWKYKQNFLIDFSIFGLVPLPPTPLVKISNDLEMIERDISSVINRFNKIKVITYTKEEDEQELKEMLSKTDND